MKVLDTKHKKKSAVITAIILLLLLVGIFNFGMKYLDPPVEYGLAINFGNSEVGSGEPVEKTREKSSQEEVQEEIQEEVAEQVEETPKEQVKEDVITEETTEDVPVVEKTKEVKEEVVKETPKEEKPIEKPVEKTKAVEKTKPVEKQKASESTINALNSLLNGNSKDGGSKGEGDDKQEGVKGNQNGDPNSNKYYGNSGSGSGGNYNLAGRNALSKPIKKPNCEEEGTVVVTIEVDKNGKVIKAIPGAKGSTNTAPCLLDPAKQAALQTKWNADGNAPTKQRGTIIYKFSLSK